MKRIWRKPLCFVEGAYSTALFNGPWGRSHGTIFGNDPITPSRGTIPINVFTGAPKEMCANCVYTFAERVAGVLSEVF